MKDLGYNLDIWEHINGGNYNSLSLGDQYKILSDYYPIGAIFCHKYGSSVKPVNEFDKDDYKCRIIDYVSYNCDKGCWIILRVENLGISIESRGKVYEECHPGIFRPSMGFLREWKMSMLGI